MTATRCTWEDDADIVAMASCLPEGHLIADLIERRLRRLIADEILDLDYQQRTAVARGAIRSAARVARGPL